MGARLLAPCRRLAFAFYWSPDSSPSLVRMPTAIGMASDASSLIPRGWRTRRLPRGLWVCSRPVPPRVFSRARRRVRVSLPVRRARRCCRSSRAMGVGVSCPASPAMVSARRGASSCFLPFSACYRRSRGVPWRLWTRSKSLALSPGLVLLSRGGATHGLPPELRVRGSFLPSCYQFLRVRGRSR